MRLRSHTDSGDLEMIGSKQTEADRLIDTIPQTSNNRLVPVDNGLIAYVNRGQQDSEYLSVRITASERRVLNGRSRKR